MLQRYPALPAGGNAVVGRDAVLRIAIPIAIRNHLHQRLEVFVQLYRVPVQIVPRPGILDPQGTAVVGALKSLGFDSVVDVRIGRFMTVDVDAETAQAATAAVQRMCEKLLANPVIEDFVLEAPVVQQRSAP